MGRASAVRVILTIRISLAPPWQPKRSRVSWTPFSLNKMSTPRVTLYDTTLRDGTQGTGISFSVLDKIRVAEKLDDFGIDYIEGGWPGSNPKDAEFFKEAAKRKWKHARLAAFGMTRKGNTNVEADG